MRREPAFAGWIVAAVIAAGCTGGSDHTATSPTSPSVDAPVCAVDTATDESALPVATVAMVDRTFLPGCFVVPTSGQILRLKNADHTRHTFTIDGTDVDIEVPAGTTITTDGGLGLAPGTYPFHCRIHASMTGVVIVRADQ